MVTFLQSGRLRFVREDGEKPRGIVFTCNKSIVVSVLLITDAAKLAGRTSEMSMQWIKARK